MHGNLLDHGFFAWVDRECDRGGAMGEGGREGQAPHLVAGAVESEC